VAVDRKGNVYIGVSGSPGSRVRKVSPAGTITTFAGGGPVVKGAGDGGLATSAFLAGGVQGLAVDGRGNVYISVSGPYDARVRKVDTDGRITTFAGGGQSLGSGIPATSARFSALSGVAVDGKGNVYIADYNESLVRKVTPGGTLTTFAGGGHSTGDGGRATSAAVTEPEGVAADAAGNVYIASQGIRKVDLKGIITTIASGQGQSLGDGGPARSANLTPRYVAVDAQGTNLYVTDFQHASVRKITATAPKTGSTPAVATLARSLETVLTQMASQRATLTTTLGRAAGCSLSARAASNRVAAVTRSRQRVLDRLGRLKAPDARTARIKSLLMVGLSHSIAADLHYRDWLAHSASRCATTRTADLSAAQREDRSATAAKQKFVGAFDPLARKLHLRTWTPDQI
jgi:DNA-binding beta-propeller fold protein YncE